MGPSELNADDLLDVALEAASRAGELLATRFGGPASGVDTKTSTTDLVSDADRDAERAIVETISARRPNDAILAEEGGGEGDARITWVVDPLDGTVNYLFGIPVWCVSIAALDGAEPVVAVVYDPNRQETFTAAAGEGAFLDGARLHVSDREDLAHSLVGTGFSYDPATREAQAAVVGRILTKVRDIRRTGSAALDLTSVACGRIDAFYEANMEPWDKAAGILLVREAGGRVSRLMHPLLPPPRADSGLVESSHGLVAANPVLEKSLSDLLTQEDT